MIRTDRLRKLANHLLTGNLGHENFSFFEYNNSIQPKCGTSGCAIGECPIVWPDEWGWNWRGSPSRSTDAYAFISPADSAKEWFDISYDQFTHLFVPHEQNTEIGKRLNDLATKEEVAANILQFCDMVEKGEIE